MKFSAPALAAIALATLASCGQRGPLYLPPPDVPPHSSAPAQPVPSATPSVPKADDENKKSNSQSN